MVFLEAMSCGCCIAASKTQPVEEVIKDKKNGYLVNFYDIEEFVKTIDEILESKVINNSIHNDKKSKDKNECKKDNC